MSDSPIKENRIVQIATLAPHPRNYRVHPKHQIDQLALSLQRFGQGRSIVVQDSPERMIIVAGHGIVEAAQALQWQELRADILPADWTPEQVEGYLIADNEHSKEASDNEELLAMLLREQQDAGYDLASLGTDDETLRQMLEAMGDGYLAGSEERDETEDELPEDVETRCKPGDIWQLGRHRIGCLNSLDAEQVRRLFTDAIPNMVWSDPPYGIDIVDVKGTKGFVGGPAAYDYPFGGVKARGSIGASKPFGSKEQRGTVGIGKLAKVGLYAPVIGDDSTVTAITAYRLCAEFWSTAVQIWWGANFYAHALPPSSCWLVWDKENDASYFADCELAWCNDKGAVRIFRHMWNGMLRDSEQGQKRVHPTQKPVKLAEWAFEKYGKERDVIYDPFLGSGMSVIAAENLNRTVYGCELSPEYIDVIVARWEKHTGQTATLLEQVEVAAHV